MEFFETIRGVEVIVHANQFDGDDAVGIPYGPEEVYAETLDGDEFDLTEQEVDQLIIKATCIFYGD